MERLDFCNESWDAPPENCIGWWKSRVPELGKGKVYWAPQEVLLAYFDYVRDRPDQSDTAYVMALLLVQKRILTLTETVEREEGSFLLFKNRKAKLKYELPVIEVEPARLAEIQNELAERLFMDQPYETEPEE